MESAKVIAAADTTIARIKQVREDRDNAAITEAMQPRKGWFGKVKTRTESEAIAYLDTIDAWGWRSCYAWGDLDKAKNLRRLAQHGDPVTLNEDDVRVLF
jgi:hypothetical protein